MLIFPVLIVIFGISVQRVFGDGPSRFTREEVVNKWQHLHLNNMTENLCRDAHLKLRQADYVQTQYKNTIGYELGVLASGIMEKFRHMLRIYRHYSELSKFRNSRYTISSIMNGYSVMQSDYSEMIAEIVLYYEVLEEHRKKEIARVFKARVYAKKYHMTLQSVLDLMDKGINIDHMNKQQGVARRSMQVNPPAYTDELPEEQEPTKAGNKSRTRKIGTDKEEAAYKKKLRYIMWAEKWKGFNPETEGVRIDDTIARLGFNHSDFLLKEMRGDV